MARFSASGIEGLEISFREFAEIPDEVVKEMLDAAGEVTVKAHKAKIRALKLVDSGKLVESIKAHHKAGGAKNGWMRHVLVYPTGKHGTRRRKKVTKAYKRSKHGRTYTVGGDIKDVSNSEVGFIQEFGAPRKGIKGKNWMKLANEECADEVTRAEFAIYDRWLKEKGL